jgi:hypothetical protein
MAQKNNYLVYHYELMNDGRYVLCIEPNVFERLDDVKTHIDCLTYLFGRNHFYCKECELSNLDLIWDEDKV